MLCVYALADVLELAGTVGICFYSLWVNFCLCFGRLYRLVSLSVSVSISLGLSLAPHRHLDFFEMVRNEDDSELAKRFDLVSSFIYSSCTR